MEEYKSDILFRKKMYLIGIITEYILYPVPTDRIVAKITRIPKSGANLI
ncbi:MAG: hypothetical protein ACFFE5_01220 [Candidatus Thorarchaeota archaeon]